MPTTEPAARLLDHDGSAVDGGGADVHALERRLAPYVARAEPRPRAMASLRGLLSPAERQNSWPWADSSGEAPPDALQPRLRRALWDPEAVRAERRHSRVPSLGDPVAVLVRDATGLPQKGRHSAGVARQDRGTTGQGDHGQIGVLLGDASRLGHVLLDRERSLPQAWTDDRARCQPAGIPEDRHVATTPQLARQLRARAFTAGLSAPWVTGDRG